MQLCPSVKTARLTFLENNELDLDASSEGLIDNCPRIWLAPL